jgi:NADPH-dependent ferric siderophore reductase
MRITRHVILGDETSIAAAEALIRALPADAVVLACFEVASSERRWPECELLRPDTVHWIDRAGRPGAALLARLAEQSLPSGKGTTAYVTGEAWLCGMVHSHLVRARLSSRRDPRHAVLESETPSTGVVNSHHRR